MRKLAQIVPAVLVSLCLAGTSWAGGASCSGEGAKASADAAGKHCTYKGANAMAGACEGVTASQVMYSYAVPSVECDHCIDAIQKAAMTQNGIHCVHIDLTTHTAYVIADKKMSQKQVAKVIADAGYKNKYQGTGKKTEAAFAKAMASGDKSMNACCAKKDKV